MITRSIGAGLTPPDRRRPITHPRAERAGRPRPLPVLATYAPPTVQFVRGAGTELWDSAGRRYLDFLGGLAVVVARPRPPRGGRRPRRAGPTLLHVSNLFGTVPGAEVAVTLDRLLGGGGQVFFCNSGAEANEAAIKLARQVGRPRASTWSSAPTARSTAAPWPPCTPPASRPSTRPSSRCPRASATWPGTTSTPSRRPSTQRGRGAARAGPGRGRGQPGQRRVLPGRAAPVRRAGRAVHGRRGPDRPRPHRAVVRLRALRRRAPTWSRWPRRSATACRSAPAGPAATSPRSCGPATTAPPSAASPWPRPRPGRCCAIMEREDAPGRAPPGRRAPRRPRSTALPEVVGVRGLGLLLGAELVDGHRRQGGRRRGPGRGPGRQRGHARPPCGWRRRCSCPTTRSTRRWPSWPRASSGQPHRRSAS